MKSFDRKKLDVVNERWGNIFGWRGQFTGELTRS